MLTITAATIPTATGNLTYWLHRPAGQPAGAGSMLLLTFCSTRQAAFYEHPYNRPYSDLISYSCNYRLVNSVLPVVEIKSV